MNIVQHHNIQCWRIRHIPRYMRAPNDMSSTPLLSPKTSKNAAFAEHHVIQIIPHCSLFNKSEMTWIARCTTSLLMQALSMLYQQSKVVFNFLRQCHMMILSKAKCYSGLLIGTGLEPDFPWIFALPTLIYCGNLPFNSDGKKQYLQPFQRVVSTWFKFLDIQTLAKKLH